jgi:hypothetical protein
MVTDLDIFQIMDNNPWIKEKIIRKVKEEKKTIQRAYDEAVKEDTEEILKCCWK